MVEIRQLDQRQPPERAPVGRDGHFEFRSLAAGSYQVTIINAYGQIIREELVSIRGSNEPLTLQLPFRKVGLPPSGTISAARLLHPILSQAAKEFARSQEAFRAGDISTSIEHLRKAIRRYPDYLEAHNNLGVRYMALNQYDNALEEFQRAVALDPESPKAQLNLSLALSTLRRPAEAEAPARRAVELEPDSVAAHYALGQILAVEGKDAREALAHSRKAVERFPRARLVVARVLAQQGAIAEAVAELRLYLDSGSPENRQQVEAWIEGLSKGAPPEH